MPLTLRRSFTEAVVQASRSILTGPMTALRNKDEAALAALALVAGVVGYSEHCAF
jgi:hypothetical protein